MLEIRPTCEHCNKALPPNSTEARICSYECTFCAACADHLLHSICPNCGGGLVPRPIRPASNWINSNYLGNHPASVTTKYNPANLPEHGKLVKKLQHIPPERR